MKHVNCCLASLWGVLWERLDWVHKCNKGYQFWVTNMFLHAYGLFKGMRIGSLMIGYAWFFSDETNINKVMIGHMIGHGVGLEIENALDLNMFMRPWSMVVNWWWFGNAWRLLGRERGTWLKVGWIENFLWSTIQNYNLDPSRMVFQFDNDHKHASKSVQEWLVSKPFQLLQLHAQSLGLSPIEYLWTLLKRRLNKFLQHLQEVSKNCGSVFSLSQFQWTWLYGALWEHVMKSWVVLKIRGYWTNC